MSNSRASQRRSSSALAADRPRHRTDSSGEGSLDIAVTGQDWLTPTQSMLEGLTEYPAFRLPDYPIRVLGTELSGDTGPCALPSGPDTFCSGFIVGPRASVAGEINGKGLTLNAWLPSGSGLSEGFSYHVSATAVPLPGTLLLLASGLLGLFAGPRCTLNLVLSQQSRA